MLQMVLQIKSALKIIPDIDIYYIWFDSSNAFSPGSLSPFSGPAVSKGELIQLSKEVMGDMLKVIILCAQDELDSLGWCVCTGLKNKLRKIIDAYNEQTCNVLNHLKVCCVIHDFKLYICICCS